MSALRLKHFLAALLVVAPVTSGFPPTVPTAHALKGEDCPTWFPDFRGCGRSGRFDGFVAPIQMPYLFEDPFITTGAQLVGIYHEYPGHSIFEGGHLWVMALQLRLAITDRLAFIATKDGYVWDRPDLDILRNEDGWYDISAGFKYALIQNREKRYIVSPSFRIDMPVGKTRVYQNRGSGVGIPTISGAWAYEKFNTMIDFGARLPFQMGEESTSLFWNLHLSYRVWKHFVPLVEFGGMNWTGAGNGKRTVRTNTPLGNISLKEAQEVLQTGSFEGVDVANLGSPGVAGNGIVIGTFGARFPVNKHISFGGAYSFPLTDRDDIWKQRGTFNILVEF